jgi:nucleoside-diphosphate-sugar epimerase
MHTILGAGGVIARELSTALKAYTDLAPHIRQVGRNPQKVNPSDELVPADLLDAAATSRAVAGSDVVYLVAGLKYNTAVWQTQWPLVMRNVLDACAHHGSRLVFLDNVYAYGAVSGPMTEETPFNPCSKKGEVRAQIATMMLEAIAAGSILGLIARSADFYGPGAINSFPHATVFTRLKAGKTPQWIGNPQAQHTFTYTPDAGRALAYLGNTPAAYGQTWHLPTSREEMTGTLFAHLACEVAGRPKGLQTAPAWVMNAMSMFIPVLRENKEMMYQFTHDYRFNSHKIEAAFGLTATSYHDGIEATLGH